MRMVGSWLLPLVCKTSSRKGYSSSILVMRSMPS